MKEIRILTPHTVAEFTVAEAKAKRANVFPDWNCTVGMNCIYIDFDGIVWRGPCRVGGKLGHMLTDWQLPKDTIRCNLPTCDCGTGIKLPKTLGDDISCEPVEPQLFNVQWDLGRRCNFDCSYCWPTSHNKTDPWVDIDVLLKVVDKIEARYDGKMQFNIAGGEPTLHPDFLEFCSYIWSRGHHIHVQTNGTMNVTKARDLAMIAELSISVHFEFANLSKITDNVRSILSGPHNGLEVKMMVPPMSYNSRIDEDIDELRRGLESIPNIDEARVIVTPLRDPDTNQMMPYSEFEFTTFGDLDVRF